nr:HNH endonuclease [Aneurinibacillus sp. XH2]
MKNKYEIRGPVTAIFIPRKDGTQLETIISTFDLDLVDEFPNTWTATYSKQTDSYYVIGYLKAEKGRSKNVRLHRWIKEAPNGRVVDHINHNTLDNRRNNLRVVTQAANMLNRRAGKKNTSGVPGVHFDIKRNKWHARIQIDGKRHDLGFFDDIDKAKEVVDKMRDKAIRRRTRSW